MKILIIEDEVLIQQSLKKLLQKRGIDVDVSSDGKNAIKLIYQNNYDRIVCDLMLHDITGFDIIEESKKIYNSEDIKRIFVIMTAYSSEQVLEKAKQYGCKILNKPFVNLQEALKFMYTLDHEEIKN
jgi:CheY-like chemotaxis protein